jgi:hypothetical protein
VPAVVVLGVLALLLRSATTVADTGDGTASEIARQTVALALGIAPDSAQVISSVPRDFPDASLDCPQPGAAYAQVITPGFQVLVEADGRRFDVRVAGTSGRICHRRKAAAPAAEEKISPRTLAESARRDLADRLGVPPGSITVSGLRRLKPGESLPGCGEVCAWDSEPADCGVLARLQFDDRSFDYVAGPAGVRPCPDIADR